MFGRDTESLADAQKSLSAEMENISAEIGEVLLPVMQKFAVFMRDDVVPVLRDTVDWVKENEQVFEAFGTAVDIVVNGPLKAAQNTIQQDMEATQEAAAKLALDGFGPVITYATLAGAELAGAGRAADDATAPIAGLRGPLTDVKKAAKDAADRLDDFTDAALDALDAATEAAFGPEELRLKLELARGELKDTERALRDLERIKDPTRAQRQDINETRLALIEDRKEVLRLEGRLLALDGLSFSDIIGQFNKLGNKIDWTSKEGRELLRILGGIGAAGAQLGLIGAAASGGGGGRASGGPVLPGRTYTVGESGTETLVMGRSGGFVIPNGGGGGGGSSGSPVVIQLQLDGRVVAEVVDRHMAYMAARAPQSPYSG
jgi:hypothetical protein